MYKIIIIIIIRSIFHTFISINLIKEFCWDFSFMKKKYIYIYSAQDKEIKNVICHKKILKILKTQNLYIRIFIVQTQIIWQNNDRFSSDKTSSIQNGILFGYKYILRMTYIIGIIYVNKQT